MGATDYDHTSALVVDVNNNIYLTGTFYSDSITFDSITLYNNSNSNIFIAKFDPFGNVLWAKSSENRMLTLGDDLTVNANGEIFLSEVLRIQYLCSTEILYTYPTVPILCRLCYQN